MGIEPTSSAWKADILADVLYPHLQKRFYHISVQMSSPNFAGGLRRARPGPAPPCIPHSPRTGLGPMRGLRGV